MSRSFVCLLLAAWIGFAAAPACAQTPEADSLLNVAEELAKQGAYAPAIAEAERAYRSAVRALGKTDPRLAKPLLELARIHELQGNAAEAAAYRTAVATLEQPGANGKQIADALDNLAATLATLNAAKEEANNATRSLSHHHASKQASPSPLGEAAPPATGAASRGLSAPDTETGERSLASSLPEFPWPPPVPSAQYEFPKDAFKLYSTVGQVTDFILGALRPPGYVEYSFFQTHDGGVALVTRLEKIGNDGSSAAESERWPPGFNNEPGNFVDFVRGLFFAKPGHYRVIVFILQEASFTVSKETVSGETALGWVHGGMNKLPQAIARRAFGKDSTCTALIYEFASNGSAVKVVQSSLTGRQHLERAGVLATLEQR